MIAKEEPLVAQKLWGTFGQVRERLAEQFLSVQYLSDTGLTPQELSREAASLLRACADEPRVLQKARIFALILTQAQIALDPWDWFPSKLNHGGLLRQLGEAWDAEAREGPLREEAGWFEHAYHLGLVKGGLDTGHISPGWENMFRAGLEGLIDEARSCRRLLGPQASAEQLAFYQAVEIVYRATVAFSLRLAELARRMAATDTDNALRLEQVAACCERVPAHAPQTLHQALQFAWLMHELIEMEGEYVRSAGHFDRLFYPYYRADITAGRLTPAQAKELIKFFWIKHYAHTRGRANGKNLVFCGQHADGSDATNELTDVALEAYEELNVPDPKLSVRFCSSTPDGVYRRVAELIRSGHNSFVLMNDEPAIEGLVRRGKTLADARTYLPIGCYEPAVDGKEAACTMNLVFNLAKALELALHNGADPLTGEQLGLATGDPREMGSFPEVLRAYEAQLEWLIARSIGYVRAHELQWPQINPSPLIAGTIADCLPRGRDIGQGGAHYNSVGCVGMALANTCDSLLAVQRCVFEERRYRMDELLAALSSDFAGHEDMRQYLLHRVPKWGNGDSSCDAQARRIADHYCATVHGHGNARGGPCQAALFSLDYQWRMGRAVGALPDGRKAGASLAPGVGPSSGADRHGVTALISSVTSLDFGATPNGAVLDVMLHPSAVRGPEGLEAFVALIKTFLDRGGYAIQFNVVDVDTLRDAQSHPERYATLQIRVTGWSVYFSALSPSEQEQFILRNAHSLS